MTKREFLFLFSCFLVGSLFLLLSSPLVISTDWILMLFGWALLFFSQSINIGIAGLKFNMRSFLALYLLLFLPPESVGLLSIVSIILSTKKFNTIALRVSFEFLQFSVGTFLYRQSPNDYLSILLFAIGYFVTNILLSQIYIRYLVKDSLSKYVIPFMVVFVLGIYGSAVLMIPYTFSEITFGNLMFSTMLYAGFLIQLYYTIKAETWRQELTIEKEQVAREVENLMKLPEIILEIRKEDVDKVLENMLSLAANISGFSYALLNVLDYTTGKVLRVANYGIDDEAFKNLKEKKPDIKDTLVLMQQRFDIGGAYFIPKGSIDLDENYVYTPSYYTKVDSENAWDPEDLFLVPINQGGRMIGYLSLDKPTNMLRPSKREIEMSKFFAWQIGEILAESKYSTIFTTSHKKEQSLSKFMDELSKNISVGTAFVLSYMDIDQFKVINFSHGFSYGDEIIREMKNIINDELKNLGIFSQVSDEFLILVWSKSKSDGILISEKIISSAKKKFENITISAGVVKYPTDANTLEEMLDKAQIALSAAKKSGGGRVVSL
ncbi:MAG TPA: GGDEF domain-containing protein [Fervidobacterium sp.]|nr:GGDEF domain-containing protein [Fervidobacterium sp.]HPP18100.1 GGDEF domain-containing protein [Fervidobacterium sp.]HRD19933.1 GGDEF domain-containing protein [Fervidobacterium sp.]